MKPFAGLERKANSGPCNEIAGCIYPLSRQIEDNSERHLSKKREVPNVPYVPMEPRFELGYLGRGSRTDRVAMLEAEQPIDLLSKVKLDKLYSRTSMGRFRRCFSPTLLFSIASLGQSLESAAASGLLAQEHSVMMLRGKSVLIGW